jgi:signal peptidase I
MKVIILWASPFSLGSIVQFDLVPIKGYKIKYQSMMPTIMPDELFVIERGGAGNQSLERGNVVVFQIPTSPGINMIKRVIALPGETVEVVVDDVYINRKKLTEHYIKNQNSKPKRFSKYQYGPYVVPPDHFFLLGDNRAQSFDGRHFGSISAKAIKGKALYIIWSKTRGRIGTKID